MAWASTEWGQSACTKYLEKRPVQFTFWNVVILQQIFHTSLSTNKGSRFCRKLTEARWTKVGVILYQLRLLYHNTSLQQIGINSREFLFCTLRLCPLSIFWFFLVGFLLSPPLIPTPTKILKRFEERKGVHVSRGYHFLYISSSSALHTTKAEEEVQYQHKHFKQQIVDLAEDSPFTLLFNQW